MQDCEDFLSTKQNFYKTQQKTLKSFKEKTKSMQSLLSQALYEKELLKTKYSELEKKLFDSNKELKKLRKKLSSRKSKSLSMEEEKFCSKCQKTYTEKDNFNWSCKTHLGIVQNNMFWCCGIKGKDSEGCIVAKHQSNEEENEIEDDFVLVKFCTGCKKSGHGFAECPKDPNFKTRGESMEEKKRLEVLYLSRRRLSVLEAQSRADQRIFLEINERMDGSDFARVADTQEEVDEMNGVFFGDLLDIKDEVRSEIGRADEREAGFELIKKSSKELDHSSLNSLENIA